MSDGSLALWIPGLPIAWARVATRGFQRYTPEPYASWLAGAAGHVLAQRDPGARGPMDGPVALAVRVFPNGVGVVLTPAADSARPKGLQGDLDNYGKAVADALEHGGAIVNDRKVEAVTLAFCPHPGGPK